MFDQQDLEFGLAKPDDELYPGLIRVQERWAGSLCEVGRGFRHKPDHEEQREALTHLVAYVGEHDGSLSPALEISSRYMDCPFDGLCVHVVPKLPEDIDEIKDFRIAAVLGPSGSGTSTLTRELFGLPPHIKWNELASVRDHLPEDSAGTELLDVVGLSAEVASRPIGTLSGGEQFRARLARLLIHPRDPNHEALVLEDFTSVLDRPAAQDLSAKLQHYVVKHDLQR